MEKQEKSLFELKPNLTAAIIPTLISGVVLGAILSLFIGVFAGSWLIGFLGLVIITILSSFSRFMNLRATKYVFYKDRAEFFEGFFSIVKRTIRYQKITDSVMTKGLVDKIFQTGTIRLITPGTEFVNDKATSSGIMLYHINNPDEIYSKIENLLKK